MFDDFLAIHGQNIITIGLIFFWLFAVFIVFLWATARLYKAIRGIYQDISEDDYYG